MVRTLRQKAVDLKIAPEEIARLIDERIQGLKTTIRSKYSHFIV